MPSGARPGASPLPALRREHQCLSCVTVKGKKASRAKHQKSRKWTAAEARKRKKLARTATNRDISCPKTAIVNRKMIGRNMLFQNSSERTQRGQRTGFLHCAIFCGPLLTAHRSPHWCGNHPEAGLPASILLAFCLHPALILPSSWLRSAPLLPCFCPRKPAKTGQIRDVHNAKDILTATAGDLHKRREVRTQAHAPTPSPRLNQRGYTGFP